MKSVLPSDGAKNFRIFGLLDMAEAALPHRGMRPASRGPYADVGRGSAGRDIANDMPFRT